ncbi:unnamed protein product [Schistocephalus solidus]|uniref:Uncharacterized protein n=1 Tax=Schistocephalus solidus TaxID=70667 RepID=A0A183TGN7_SCHSO|nr:unnamed protein product [Schistocephalus solidus]
MFKNLSHLPYEIRLVELDLFPLNYMQLRGDLIQTYRIVRGRDCSLEFADFFELAGTEHLRGHPFKLHRKFVHMEVRRNAFSQRVVGAWNGLPDEINGVKGLIARTRRDFEVDLLNRATVNPKLFYGYVSQCTWNKDPIPLLKTAAGIDLTEDGAKAGHLLNFSAFNADCFTKVFGTFVWPQFESAIQAWRPWAAKDTNILEKVQKRATKPVLGQS